jgi:hypothetical protein
MTQRKKLDRVAKPSFASVGEVFANQTWIDSRFPWRLTAIPLKDAPVTQKKGLHLMLVVAVSQTHSRRPGRRQLSPSPRSFNRSGTRVEHRDRATIL